MLSRTAAILTLLVALGACAGPEPAAPPPDIGMAPRPLKGSLRSNEFQVGSWLGMRSSAESGQFGACAVSAVYERDRALLFTLDSRGTFTFTVRGPEWTLSKGDRHPLSFRLDGQPYETQAVVILPDTLRADSTETRLLLFDFRNASLLTVETLGERLDFRLTGVAAAFDAMMNCVKNNVGAETAPNSDQDTPTTGSNPFVTPGDGTPSKRPATGGSNPFVSQAPSGRAAPSDAIAAAADFVERLLGEAGLTDHRILTGADVPADDRGFDVVVRIGGQIAALNLVEARRYHSVAEASAAIVKDASLICGEGFSSSITARHLRDGRPAAQMQASCTNPKIFHTAYTIVPVAGVGYYRLSMTTFGDPAEIDVIQARIGGVLARLVPEE